MKKIIALAVASAFAFGAASTFAAHNVKSEPVQTKQQVRHVHKVKHAKAHKAKHSKKSQRHAKKTQSKRAA